ncbi:GDSL-type esterase/lipase family protein [Tumebacillus lipolyticus]|uniref:GDSL-type esterase/lipase family protein n=1 Tax=Tumebacillus lipolyticus TaxID=1280370 RepID=A0ABW5A0C4_9BACL
MKKKRSFLWGSVLTLALASVVVLGGGFFLALTQTGDVTSSLPAAEAPAGQDVQPTVATDAKGADSNLIVAIGDSLTKGVGDTSGKGYVGNLKSRLEASGQQVQVQNLGISGLESAELAKSVQNPGVQQYFHDAKLIMVSIGGNDITHSIGGVDKIINLKSIDEAAILATQKEYTKNVEQVLTTIRKSNQKAPIIILGLYNPFEGLFEDQGASEQLLLGWNDNLRQLAQSFQQVKVVPMFDLFQWNNDSLLSFDHFHPNNEGYDRMAERIFNSLPKSK